MRGFSYLQPDWPAPPHVCAASTLRTGGVSVGAYENFNLALHVDDVPAAVLENRHRLANGLHLPVSPYWLNQVHGDVVVEANASGTSSPPKTADASIARTAGQVCVVMTADCLPVLFTSREGDRVAAAHAGWRGLAGGVLDSTVASLNLPGSELMAWLGPAISQRAFEVGDEVRVAFLAQDAGAASAFTSNARGRWQCDLYQLARRNLARLGVHDIYGGDCCTYGDERFFSYRRAIQDGSQNTGRMASLIWISSPNH